MEEVNQSPVDSTNDASSTEVKSSDTVSYDSFRKSVEAEKNARKKAQDLEAQLEQIRQQELEKEGKLNELVDTLRKENSSLKADITKKDEIRAWDKITSAIKGEAQKAGCINPDKLIKLFEKDDFLTLQSEGNELREESVQALVEKAKRENDFLFSKGTVRYNDVVPTSTVQQKDPSEMSKDEILAQLQQLK